MNYIIESIFVGIYACFIYLLFSPFITPFYISNADFYSIKKIKKCKINFDGLTKYFIFK